ncbi:MarR family winged helix-turn-helix transcriptional regulator [Rhodococcoides fascians]|uniref:MarR family winged helix-turn-helix transcriptional regulator n=1 Tax=Rhodococcoides fascians TaxID=1828 RepID=UPI00050CAA6D|nr:MarR family transcriptional regulator [Rhodococcus fascians]
MIYPLRSDLGFLLSRVSGLVVKTTNAALAAHGLRVRHYSVLALACETSAGSSQRDLASVLGLDPSQVVLLVDELAGSGLIERRPDPNDRRSRLVAATEAGRSLHEVAGREAAAVLDERSWACLSEAEQSTLRVLLTRIWASTEQQ